MTDAFAPSFHTSILAIASILLVYAVLSKDKSAHLVALAMVIFELGRFLVFNPSERLHMSLDLLIVGGMGISLLLSKLRTVKALIVFLGCGVFIGHHHTEFIDSDKSIPMSNDVAESSSLKANNQAQLDQDMELMIQFDSHSNIQSWIKDNAKTYEITYPLFTPKDKSQLLDEYVGVNVTDDSNIALLIDELRIVDGVLDIERNEIIQIDQEPLLASDKLINDKDLDKQWVTAPFELEDYHRFIKGRKVNSSQSTTVVAILDTGVEATHEDLMANYISTRTRYDKDVKGHGTHCAGVAAAVTGNNLGIASLLPSQSPVKVTGIKVLGDRGMGTQKMIIDGMIEAADLGYSVISMSLGGMSNDKRQAAYSRAVKYATSKGAIVVTAAGNAGRDASRHSPANTPGVISVAAIDPTGQLASFSNTVDGLKMGTAAPGVDIYSTIPGNSYQAYSGTSMATPFVSGLIGLMKYYDSSLTTEQVYELFEANADRIDGVPVFQPLKTMEAFFASLDSGTAE